MLTNSVKNTAKMAGYYLFYDIRGVAWHIYIMRFENSFRISDESITEFFHRGVEITALCG